MKKGEVLNIVHMNTCLSLERTDGNAPPFISWKLIVILLYYVRLLYLKLTHHSVNVNTLS